MTDPRNLAVAKALGWTNLQDYGGMWWEGTNPEGQRDRLPDFCNSLPDAMSLLDAWEKQEDGYAWDIAGSSKGKVVRLYRWSPLAGQIFVGAGDTLPEAIVTAFLAAHAGKEEA